MRNLVWKILFIVGILFLFSFAVLNISNEKPQEDKAANIQKSGKVKNDITNP